MADRKGSIQIAPDLASFFTEEVSNTVERQGLKVSLPTRQYLGRVLTRFADANHYFETKSGETDGKKSLPTLALMWLEGLSTHVTERLFHMQHLGDVALFTSGFFGERIARSSLDMDYYIAMGGAAYNTAGKIRETISAERALNTYFELAENFGEFVEVFAEVADRSRLHSDKDLIKLYERWLESRSFRLARMLAERGVITGGSGPSKE